MKDWVVPKQFEPENSAAPTPEDWLAEWPVIRALNNPRHEGPVCAAAVSDDGTGTNKNCGD
jgi:hypothetical protein